MSQTKQVTRALDAAQELTSALFVPDARVTGVPAEALGMRTPDQGDHSLALIHATLAVAEEIRALREELSASLRDVSAAIDMSART